MTEAIICDLDGNPLCPELDVFVRLENDYGSFQSYMTKEHLQAVAKKKGKARK